VSLRKGFEVELYTGFPDGQVVGLSDKVVDILPHFMREPDSRNVEYITPPLFDYRELLCALLKPRKQLRQTLSDLGGYTIIPGSTLPLKGASLQFHRSDPQNPYHDRIEQAYGTRVVTASIHINFGIPDPELVLKACRLLRLEAPVVLALSASSPFLDGAPTGYHSSRWGLFPKTPEHVPLFTSHQHYIDWVQQQLALGTMWNVRHLWSSVRPNGPDRPFRVDRAELRISDLIIDPRVLLGMTLLLEHRLLDLLSGKIPEPLESRHFTPDELVEITTQNEVQAARYSLDAPLVHWQTGETLTARTWANQWLEEMDFKALSKDEQSFLEAVKQVLVGGNEAMRWLGQYKLGLSVPQIVQEAIQSCKEQEEELTCRLCTELLH
jgi:predicted glutamate--cysteine ligase